jgi:folate-binding protein YgfZ
MATAPLKDHHERYARVESLRLGGVAVEAEWLPYGVGGEPAAGAAAELPEIVATYGLLELEYAAFRRGAAVLDRAHRGTIVVEGADRIDFLNRMVTQDLKGMQPGEARAAWWLNRKGRIEADLLLCEVPAGAAGEPACMLVDCDVHDVARTVETLSAFLFAEDVRLRDARAEWARLAVHGPAAVEVLAHAGADPVALEPLVRDGTVVRAEVGGVACVLVRRDECGCPGVDLFVPPAAAGTVWDSIVSQHDVQDGGKRRARPAGWHAFNIARIEAGTPLFHVDYGPDNLPHETGVIATRTSFRKGCYLGQEVVARMESLGKPKQRLVGVRFGGEALPVAGAPVFERLADGAPGNPVGSITSSTLSPMLGAACVGFAMVRTAHAEPGTVLPVPADGERAEATVLPALRTLPAEAVP